MAVETYTPAPNLTQEINTILRPPRPKTVEEVVTEIFLETARGEFSNRDKGYSNIIHIANEDYRIKVTPELWGIIRPMGEDVSFAEEGEYSHGEWMYLVIPHLQINAPAEDQ